LPIRFADHKVIPAILRTQEKNNGVEIRENEEELKWFYPSFKQDKISNDVFYHNVNDRNIVAFIK